MGKRTAQNPNFEGMIGRFYSPELQLSKTDASDTEALFYLYLSISSRFVSYPIYDKRDDIDFDIVNFPFLYGEVPCATPFGLNLFALLECPVM